ncbi:MAG TPA: G5 domain-containing protein [Anaerolineales bacterium]|nr:G5 domain-containing protein [Anaerolineales bacterium]
MKFHRNLVLAVSFLLVACQPSTPPSVTIIDNDQVITLQTEERITSALLAQAGINLDSGDRVLLNGHAITLDEPINSDPITIQIRYAVNLTLIMPDGQQQIQSSAFTVGEMLDELPYWLHAKSEVEPPLNTALTDGMTIAVSSPRVLAINVDGGVVDIQSSAPTVGEALAEARIPLLGLDYSLPSENEALPSDGQIKVVRVSEPVLLVQKPIPFESELIAAAEVPLDQTQILSPGENGLSVQRIRVRYEDGNEVSRVTENETIVRLPKTRTLGYGTKIEVKTETINGTQIEYWRAVQMYATSYSPCRLGTGTCGSTTASGKQLQKGMVALPTNQYISMQGQPLFIPGYGFATVEDACGGCVGQPWIDLGYSDDDYEPWYSWVTVYFLTPVPQNIVYILE